MKNKKPEDPKDLTIQERMEKYSKFNELDPFSGFSPLITGEEAAPSMPVADANCKDFHYTADEKAQVEKKKADVNAKIDLSLRKHLDRY